MNMRFPTNCRLLGQTHCSSSMLLHLSLDKGFVSDRYSTLIQQAAMSATDAQLELAVEIWKQLSLVSA